ncbi:hypothetical protein ABGB12_22840 [Actinocorallia sp. B10E7]|uniref:hypothetical protein n=1 Tax=Actinocorallia sp. B10E7 TaxID=3153558 RepID=UPI00325D176A
MIRRLTAAGIASAALGGVLMTSLPAAASPGPDEKDDNKVTVVTVNNDRDHDRGRYDDYDDYDGYRDGYRFRFHDYRWFRYQGRYGCWPKRWHRGHGRYDRFDRGRHGRFDRFDRGRHGFDRSWHQGRYGCWPRWNR